MINKDRLTTQFNKVRESRLFTVFTVLVLPVALAYLISGVKLPSSIKDLGRAEEVEPEIESVFVEYMKPLYFSPAKMKISSVGIDIKVSEVGVEEDGVLETPKNWNEGGWYFKSSKPSEGGNMLINAHYDDNFGRPAAFWQLKNVKRGDIVSVVDEVGREHSYQITDVYFVSVNDPQRAEILSLGDGDEATLTLITCGGVWDSSLSTYDKRLIVKARLSI